MDDPQTNMKQVAVCATAARARMRRVLQVVGGGAVAAGTVLAAQGDEGRRRALFGLAQLDDKLRPALATLLPAEIFIGLYSASRSPFINALSVSVGSPAEERSISTPVSAMGLAFRNDLGNAAGLDKDGSLLEFNYSLGAGFAVVGTVLSESHTGNLFSLLGGLWTGNVWTPLPHSGGALNSLGARARAPKPTTCRRRARVATAFVLAPLVATVTVRNFGQSWRRSAVERRRHRPAQHRGLPRGAWARSPGRRSTSRLWRRRGGGGRLSDRRIDYGAPGAVGREKGGGRGRVRPRLARRGRLHRDQ